MEGTSALLQVNEGLKTRDSVKLNDAPNPRVGENLVPFLQPVKPSSSTSNDE
jgi:hypothetical protein